MFEDKNTREWLKKKGRIDEIFDKTRKQRDKMSRHLRHFRGDIWDIDRLETYDSKAFINMLFATVEAQAPLITDSRPITRIIPKRPFLQAVAQVYNYGIRYYWDTQELQDKIYKWVLDAKIMGKGIIKLFRGEGEGIDSLKCEVVDPRVFFLSPGYDDEIEAPQMGERVLMPLSWVRENYPKKADKVKGSYVDVNKDNQEKDKYGPTNLSAEEKAGKYARIYKVWERDDLMVDSDEEDKEGKKVKKPKYPNGKWIIATDEIILEEYENADNHGKPPYVGLDNYTDPHNFLSISDIDQIDDLNKELNIQFQNWVKYVRKHHDPNYFIDANAVEDVETIKQEKDKGGNVWAVDMTMAKDAPIQPVKDGDFIPEALRMFDVLPNIMQRISGDTDVLSGVAATKEQSASEVAILAESSHTRIRQQVRNLEKALKRVTWILVNMMQQYMDSPEVIHWTDEQTGEVGYANLGNSKAQAANLIASPETIEKGRAMEQQHPPTNEKEAMGSIKMESPEKEAWEDWKAFAEEYKDSEDFDPIYFGFEIEIETNSSLPLDKQSRANMIMNLANVRVAPDSVIDRLTILKILQVPGAEEINKVMEEKERAVLQPPGPPPQEGVM